jgi:uncharacterized tellurite resistance protein B-like protein
MCPVAKDSEQVQSPFAETAVPEPGGSSSVLKIRALAKETPPNGRRLEGNPLQYVQFVPLLAAPFFPVDPMEKTDLFANLVNLAAADNKFTEEEVRFLVDRANRWGISNDEFETIMAGIEEGGIQLQVPDTYDGRIELLKEMLRLMAADGELAAVEKSLCARVSNRMNLSTEEFKSIVDEVIYNG